MSRSTLLLSLSLSILPLQAWADDTKPAPTPAQIMQLTDVEDPQISPAGESIAYVVATPQGDGKPALRRLRIVPVKGKPKVRELPGVAASDDTSPSWTGDGRRLLFLSDRPATGNEAISQVWSMAADGSDAHPLTHSPSAVSRFALSNDGRRLAYLATDPTSAEERARATQLDDAREVGQPEHFSRLWLQDIATGRIGVLTPPGMQVQDLAWSPDGGTLALRISNGTTLNDYWYDSRVVLFDLKTGRIGAPLENHASAHPLQFSPDGTRLLYGELSQYGMTGSCVVHNLASGKRVFLAKDWPGTLWLARWQDAHTLIGAGLSGVRGTLLQIDPDSGHWKTLASPQFAYPAFTTASDGRTAFIGMRNDHPGEVWLLQNGRITERTDSNPQVAGWAKGEERELEWTSSRDGLHLTGVLVTPPGWKPGTPLPTLVDLHGGPAEAWWSGWQGSWHDWAQLLATHGYAVFLPNPRGSEGQGDAFAELARHDWGGADFQDILDGVDVLERQGVVDPKRVAIGGWSYGGYMSAWAVTQTTRFKTAIVGAGVTDIGAMALTTDVQDFLPGYFGDPVANRAEYDAHSPIRYVDGVHVPVLILHGEADQRVPISQAQMFYRALKMRGVPVKMVVYPRGPHWFVEQAAGSDVQQRVLDWLDTHLR